MITSSLENNSKTPKTMLVISGGEGYIDFRIGKFFNYLFIFFKVVLLGRYVRFWIVCIVVYFTFFW